MNTPDSITAKLVIDADKTYSILINEKRVLKLNHQRYINTLVKRLRQMNTKYPGVIDQLIVPADLAVLHPVELVFSIVDDKPSDQHNEENKEKFFQSLFLSVPAESINRREITRHVLMSCGDVFQEQSSLVVLGLTREESIQELKKEFPEGLYVPLFS